MNHMVPELTDDFWGVFFPHELRLLVMRRYNNQNVKCLGFTDSSGFFILYLMLVKTFPVAGCKALKVDYVKVM